MKYIILDIDGTIADTPHSNTLDEFYNLNHISIPRKLDVLQKIDNIINGTQTVLFLTARDTSLYFKTYWWIVRNIECTDPHLFMRPPGNLQNSSDLKMDYIKALNIHPKDVVLWLDDDVDVLQAAKYEGYNAIHPDKFIAGVC